MNNYIVTVNLTNGNNFILYTVANNDYELEKKMNHHLLKNLNLTKSELVGYSYDSVKFSEYINILCNTWINFDTIIESMEAE